jgi:DNA-binding NtrC family response regulator
VLFSHSPAMGEVVSRISSAASSRAGVLIRGEEDTGRQVVARAIHAARRDASSFVVVDCAAFGEDQLELALFGNTRNAVGEPSEGDRGDHWVRPQVLSSPCTRGHECVTRDSRLHEARGGTLYLKNVTETPACVQVRLWRALRDREAVLVETRKTIALNVRAMAGVDPGIDTAVEEGGLRRALFNRLSVIRIDVPPFRSRREDLPALVNHFMQAVCAARGLPSRTLSRSALSLLTALPWRGNGAELRSLLDSVVAGVLQHHLDAGREVGLDDVLAHVRLDAGPLFSSGGTLRQARTLFEREYIANVLDQHHGRISKAAKALGLQRTNLYRKMRSLQVSRVKAP